MQFRSVRCDSPGRGFKQDRAGSAKWVDDRRGARGKSLDQVINELRGELAASIEDIGPCLGRHVKSVLIKHRRVLSGVMRYDQGM